MKNELQCQMESFLILLPWKQDYLIDCKLNIAVASSADRVSLIQLRCFYQAHFQWRC